MPQAPVDSDGDGITDDNDECVDKPETKNDFQDEDGCPDEFKKDELVVSHSIQFKLGSAELTGSSLRTLDQISGVLKKHPGMRLSVEGHTDDRGPSDENLQLSKQRARTVMNYLVEKKGIARDRLEAHGHGESRPMVDGDSPEARRKNRRVEFRVLNEGGR